MSCRPKIQIIRTASARALSFRLTARWTGVQVYRLEPAATILAETGQLRCPQRCLHGECGNFTTRHCQFATVIPTWTAMVEARPHNRTTTRPSTGGCVLLSILHICTMTSYQSHRSVSHKHSCAAPVSYFRVPDGCKLSFARHHWVQLRPFALHCCDPFRCSGKPHRLRVHKGSSWLSPGAA